MFRNLPPRRLSDVDLEYDYADTSGGFVLNKATGKYDGQLMGGAVTRAGTRARGTPFELNKIVSTNAFIRSSSLFPCRGTNGFGMATWFYTANGHSTFIEATSSPGINPIVMFLSFNRLYLSIINNATPIKAVTEEIIGSHPVNVVGFTNKWVHVVWNIYPDGKWTVFVNGVLRSTKIGLGIPLRADRYVNIGTGQATDRNNYFTGQMQKTIVRFNSIFTNEEVAQLFST